MSMTRSTATVGAATLPGPVRDSYGSWKSCGKRSSPKLPSFELAKSPAMKHGAKVTLGGSPLLTPSTD